MSANEAEREVFWMLSPLTCAFEPLTRRRVERDIFAEDFGGAAAPDGDGTENRVGNTARCTCCN